MTVCFSRCCWITTLAVVLLPWPVVADEPAVPPAMRPYADGPLTAADFQGKPPMPLPNLGGISSVAYTRCEVRFDYRYVLEQARPDMVKAVLTHVNCYALLDRQASWNTRPSDPRIMDHEQGHFDLAEIAAREMLKAMREMLLNRTVVGRGKDDKAAQADLAAKMEKFQRELLQKHEQAQAEYDRATRHGLDARAQAEHRKQHAEQLAHLADYASRPAPPRNSP